MYKNIYVLDETHQAFFLYGSDSEVFGLILEHDCVDGTSEDLLPFREGGYIMLESDPITLDRHVLCHECGDFGRVLNGKWEKYIYEDLG